IQRLIGRSLRSVTTLTALGERTIWIDCDVIQADGGTRTASITGAFVALALALEKLHARDVLRSVPLTDYVAATSVGIVDSEPLLDLAYEDDCRAEVDMNIVKTGDGRFVEVQGTAEAIPFGREALLTMLDLADEGIRQLVEKQRSLVGRLLPVPACVRCSRPPWEWLGGCARRIRRGPEPEDLAARSRAPLAERLAVLPARGTESNVKPRQARNDGSTAKAGKAAKTESTAKAGKAAKTETTAKAGKEQKKEVHEKRGKATKRERTTKQGKGRKRAGSKSRGTGQKRN